MVFPPSPVPAPDNQLVPDTTYTADVPFDVKQSSLTHRRRRWFDVRDIGTATGPYANAPGLVAGSVMRIQFDHRPDVIAVAISPETASTGLARVFLGDPGGPFMRLGAGGRAILPAPEAGVISVLNAGTTTVYGTVIAMAGYENVPDFDIVPSSGGAGGFSGTLSSNLLFSPDNTYDIGATLASRPRWIYAGSGIISPALTLTGNTLGFAIGLLMMGSGEPTQMTPPGSYYLRTDTPTVANQRLYVQTTQPPAITWVGII